MYRTSVVTLHRQIPSIIRSRVVMIETIVSYSLAQYLLIRASLRNLCHVIRPHSLTLRTAMPWLSNTDLLKASMYQRVVRLAVNFLHFLSAEYLFLWSSLFISLVHARDCARFLTNKNLARAYKNSLLRARFLSAPWDDNIIMSQLSQCNIVFAPCVVLTLCLLSLLITWSCLHLISVTVFTCGCLQSIN